jgi:neutral ceramidase
MYAGFSKFKITPKDQLIMAGYIKRGSNKAKGVLNDIFGRLCVFEEARRIIIIIVLELLAVDYLFVKRVLERIVLDPKRIEVIVCCTHTHSGPEVIVNQKLNIINRIRIEQYKASLVKKIEISFKEVQKDLRTSDKVELFYSEEEIESVAKSRINPEWIIDNKMRLLLIKNKKDKSLRGCIANFACHPTVLGYNNFLYSGDIFGQAMCLTEKKERIVFLLTNGAEGDVSTRFTRINQSFIEVKRLGLILAQGIESCIKKSEPMLGCDCNFSSINFEVPIKKMPSLLKIKNKIKKEQKNFREITINSLREMESKKEGLQSLVAQYNEIKKKNKEEIYIVGLRIGSILFVSIPGELSQETMLAVFQKIKEDIKIIILGLANGYLGYFPTEKLIQQKTYEAICSRFDKRASELLQDKIILLKDKLFY